MTDANKKAVAGKVVRDNAGPLIKSADAFSALSNIVSAARECIEIHEKENTTRAKLHAYETTEAARIQAGQQLLSQYFDQVFVERRVLYEGLFQRLDAALERGDGETAHAALRGIVDIARESPLAQMGDLSQVRALLDDPDVVWEL